MFVFINEHQEPSGEDERLRIKTLPSIYKKILILFLENKLAFS